MAEKVIVTGALGFIGFALCQRLLEKGYEVIGIDAMIDDRLKDFYDEKLLWIGRNANFHFIYDRIEDMDLKSIFKEASSIYHLAAATSRDRNWEDLRTTIEDNVGVTGKIISACDLGQKLIYTSSTQVYGDRTGVITEKTPLNPITPYSLTKMAAESLIKTQCKEKNVPYVIFRLPTIYGPWQRIDMTYHRLFCNILSNRKTVVDHDRVTEDVLFIDDILDTLIEASSNPECKNDVFNLATGKVNEWFKGRAIINNDQSNHSLDERMQVVISNEKVSKQLHFKVTTELKKGLEIHKNHIANYKHLYLK